MRDALQVGGGLAVVVAILWLLRSLVRRGSARAGGLSSRAGAPSGVVNVLARYPLARGQQVMLMGVGQRILVVHQSAGTVQTLSELTDPDEVLALRMQINGTERTGAESEFSGKVRQALEKKPEGPLLRPVEGMPGLVSETIDLTQARPGRIAGCGA